MKRWRFGTALAVLATLSSCGGGGGGGGGNPAPPVAGPAPTPSPPPSSAPCSLASRKDWAAAQLREWYLFPETLPASLNPAAYGSVEDYIDALTANARAQRKDRFFTYLTSIKEENAFYNSGSSAGFGVRFSYDTAQSRVFVAEAFEGAPALAAGIDRGTELLAIGTSAGNLKLVSEIMAAGGPQAVSDALGPSNPGVTRVLRIADASGTREVSVTKADYELTPVSSRYGAKIIDEGGRKYGYVNLRTFINTADPALRSAFAGFKAQGVTDIVVDVRYNGGGLVSIAELIGDLMGADRSASDVFSFTTFRPEKSSNNSTRYFQPKPQSIAPTRVAFIGTTSSASASELIINAFIPYLHNRAALVGTNTYGKPVGQIAVDQASCDDRLRVVAFKIENVARQGDYYDGLASKVEASCQAGDDITRQLGDPQESSTRAALDFLAGRVCTPIGASSGGITAQALKGKRELLTPQRPTAVQHEVPGAF